MESSANRGDSMGIGGWMVGKRGGMSYFGHKFRLNQLPFLFILIAGKANMKVVAL